MGREHSRECTDGVHVAPVERIARGVRMRRELWAFVDDLAGMNGTTASGLIEKWAAEKRAAVMEVA